MKLLPQFAGIKIEQKTFKAFGNEYHRYEVMRGDSVAYSCKACADCRKNKRCKGLPSVTSVSGQYGGGGLYPAGYRHALDAVFGEYTDKSKDAVKDGGWMSDYARSPGVMVPMDENNYLDYLLVYRQEVEEMPTPGTIARDFGTGVHAAMESLLKGEGEGPHSYADAVAKILSWLERGGPDGPYIVEDTEVNIFHPELMYGGQIDCVARSGNRVVIIDWKSGKDIWPSHQMQLGGYCLAYEELTGLAVSELWVVKSNNSDFDAKRVKDIDAAKSAFLSVRQLKADVENLEWI